MAPAHSYMARFVQQLQMVLIQFECHGHNSEKAHLWAFFPLHSTMQFIELVFPTSFSIAGNTLQMEDQLAHSVRMGGNANKYFLCVSVCRFISKRYIHLTNSIRVRVYFGVRKEKLIRIIAREASTKHFDNNKTDKGLATIDTRFSIHFRVMPCIIFNESGLHFILNS